MNDRNHAAELLDQARASVTGARRQTYGAPENNFQTIADFWTTYLKRAGFDLGGPLEAHDVAAMMALLKIARIGENPQHHDSWLDLAGYAACGWECSAPASEPATAPAPTGSPENHERMRITGGTVRRGPTPTGVANGGGSLAIGGHAPTGDPEKHDRLRVPGGYEIAICGPPLFPASRGTQHGELMRMHDEAERGHGLPE